jgi:hypothetical protein
MQTVTRSTKKRGKKVILPAKQEYCFQPNRITDSIYDYSLIQEKLFNTVIFNLQDAIKVSYKNEDYRQLTIWKNLDIEGKINLKIPLNEIAKPQHYDSVKLALKKLAGIVVEIPTKDKKILITGLLAAYIPETPDYSSIIDIYIEKQVAKYLIEIDKDTYGKPIHWTYFMYQVAQSASNKYTSRIYKKLCSWKQKGGFTISLEEFRQWLNLGDKYQRFSHIKEKILLPVQNDLTGKADVWFNCQEAKFVTKKGNVVTHLNFKVITPDLLESEEKLKDHVYYLLRTHFKFESRHIDQIRTIFDNTTPSRVIEKISELNEYCRENASKIADKTGYAITCLLNEFCQAKLL